MRIRLFKKGHEMKMHIIIGLGVLIALWFLNKTQNWIDFTIVDNLLLIELIVIGVIYSVMPDVDQPGSIINKYATLVLVGIALLAFTEKIDKKLGIISIVILGLLRFIEHRTLIHSVLGAVIIAAPLLYLGTIHFIVGVIAFLSHIISDNDFSLGWEKDTKLW